MIKKHKTLFKCSNAKRYKGIRAPRCNGGNPCISCTAVYIFSKQKKSKS